MRSRLPELLRDKGGYFRGTAWAVIGLLEAREVAK
jgi:hypothetical protein